MAVLGVGFTAPFERVFAGRGAGFAAQGPVQINTEPTPTAAMPDDFVAEGLTVEGRGIGCRFLPVTPIAGSSETKISTMPRPPSQCVIARHSSKLAGASGWPAWYAPSARRPP